ncbi:MAG: hypothetical protein ACR2QO_00515 [Acidimicrobiales bacterium]
MSEPPTPRPIDDRELVLTTIAVTAERASDAQLGQVAEPPLPHPIRTDHNLGHHIGTATANQGASRWDKLRKVGRRFGLPDQPRYNDAVVNALHQLDHRTQLQGQRIARLEAELAEARRVIADRS